MKGQDRSSPVSALPKSEDEFSLSFNRRGSESSGLTVMYVEELARTGSSEIDPEARPALRARVGASDETLQDPPLLVRP